MADIKELKMNITVDDGFRRIPINNSYGDEIGLFYFNPTDIGIIERYNKMADSFDSITEPLDAFVGGENDDTKATDDEYLAALNEATERLYKAVNELFGGDFAGAFFGKVNPFSPVNGAFYCEEALRSVGEFISAQFDTETKKFDERVAKYTNRAQRRAAKKK